VNSTRYSFPLVAPSTASRRSFTLGVADELTRRCLTERVPYSFKWVYIEAAREAGLRHAE